MNELKQNNKNKFSKTSKDFFYLLTITSLTLNALKNWSKSECVT